MCERNDIKGSGHLLSFTFLILVGACNIPSFQAHQDVLKKGLCSDFFGGKVSDPGNNAEWKIIQDTCARCNALNPLKAWFYTKFLRTKGARLIHIDVGLVFRSWPNWSSNFVSLYITSSNPTGTDEKLKKSFEKLPLVQNISVIKNEKLQREHIEYIPAQGTAGISLVFLGMKSCLRVENINVSYFFCNKTFENGVPLPKTNSPANGTLRVNSSCSDNGNNPENKEVFGLCSSNGTWYVPFPCLCKEGFTLGNKGCHECRGNSYKDAIGNGPCRPCPLNSIKNDGATKCKCKPDFYRFIGDNHTHACHGIPTAVQELEVVDVADRSVTLAWKAAKNRGSINDSVIYDVQCFKCNNTAVCKNPCGSRTIFKPSQENLSQLSVTISSLEEETIYMFLIYSKNSNSRKVSKEDWSKSTKMVKTLECRGNSYRDAVGNGPCTPCPLNSIKSVGATRCKCKQNFYRFIGDNHTHACHGIPTAVQELEVVDVTDRSVTLVWKAAKNRGNINDSVIYDVQCFKCNNTAVCKYPCGSRTIFKPSQENLSQLSVTISNLEEETIYMFLIYSKNSNSGLISKEDWSKRTKIVKTVVTASPVRQSKSVAVIAISVTFGILAVILVCVFVLLLIRKRKKRRDSESTVRMEADKVNCSDGDYETVVAPSDDLGANNNALVLFRDMNHALECSWEFPRERLMYRKNLGNGNFGTVKKAMALPINSRQHDVPVAVKLLKETAHEKDKENFLTELHLMKTLEHHPFVVQFFGCSTNTEPWLMIMEYLPGGDLLGFLRKSRGLKDSYNPGELMPSSRLDGRELLMFSWMAAEGMSFLASHKIVHRDLAARNILVGEGNVCKLSDFGLSREGDYNRKSGARLPIKWMAPEDLFHGQSTTMSDVWSYGILLWEIFTIGGSPYPGYKRCEIVPLLQTGYRMPSPSHCSEKLYSLMMSCWNEDPGARPTFSTISHFFQNILNNHVMCLDMAIYNEHDYMNFDAL